MEKRGKNYFGLCPFHDDKDPSFSVSPEKNIAFCMSCKTGGNPINFYRQIKNISYLEAAKELGARLGIKVEDERRVTSRYNLEYEIMNKASDFFKFTLNNTTEGLKAKEYLISRGLTEETINHFEIGLANNDFQSLSKMLVDQGYDSNLLITLGLSSRSNKNNELYDIFNNRIVFPIKDDALNVIGFSGRAVDSKDNIKYMNSQETPLFKKSDIIYNFYESLDEIKKSKKVLLFEGFFDVISAYQIGFKNSIATMGTALTESQVRLIKQHANSVTLIFDGDQAGQLATHDAIPKLKRLRLNVDILKIPNNMDPDDYIKKHQEKGFRKLFETNLKDSYRYYYENLLLRLDTNNANSVQVFVRDVNILFRDADEIILKMFETEISEKLGFDFKFSKIEAPARPLPEAKKQEKVTLNKYINAENDLIFELLKRKNHLKLITDSLIPNTYVLLENYQVLEELVEYYENNEFLMLSEFLSSIPVNLKEHLEKNMQGNFNWQRGIVLEKETIINHLEIIHSYAEKRELDAIYEQMDPNDPKQSLELLNEVKRLRQKMKTKRREK